MVIFPTDFSFVWAPRTVNGMIIYDTQKHYMPSVPTFFRFDAGSGTWHFINACKIQFQLILQHSYQDSVFNFLP